MKKFLSIILLFFSITFQSISKTQPLHPDPWSLIIYRPENFGDMNIVPCYLKIEDPDGNDVTSTAAKANYEWVSIKGKAFFYQKTPYLLGGMAMHLLLKPGIYKFSVYTPEEKQYGVPSVPQGSKGIWKSNTFLYNTNNPTNVIFVRPTVNSNGFYDGSWEINHKAPRFWKYTIPKMNP